MGSEKEFVLEQDTTAGGSDGQNASARATADGTGQRGAQDCTTSADTAAPDAPCALCGPAGAKIIQYLAAALAPRSFRQRHPVLFWGGLVLLCSLAYGAGAASVDATHEDGFAVLRVEGLITDTRPLLQWVEKIRKNDRIKGVLLRIDSPGGGAAASQELHDAIKKLDTCKPVVVSMGATAASGGLMVAMAARQVVANPSTVTGSIGVRMDIPQLQGLLEKVGIGQETLTTGRYKDAGSPVRALSPEERAYFDRVLQDMHDQFVLMVAEGRKLPVETVRAFADGRIMTGREARQHNLVDALGGQDTALALLATETGLPANSRLIEMPNKNKLMRRVLEEALGIDLYGAQHGVPAFSFIY